MVSGLVTSPWDQLRIFSGEARLMRMASNSAIGFPRSNGLERYKVFLRFLRTLRRRLRPPDFSSQRQFSLQNRLLIHLAFTTSRADVAKLSFRRIFCLPSSDLSSGNGN